MLSSAALLAACAGEPSFRGAEPIGDPGLARAHLQAMSDNGPIPLELRDVPAALGTTGAAHAAAEGVAALKVVFDPQEASATRMEGARLVLWYDGPRVPADVCAGNATIQPIPRSRPELSAAWCEGATAVAGLTGQAADASERSLDRLTWQTTRRLFPDTYIDNAGLDLFGMKVRPSASFGF